MHNHSGCRYTHLVHEYSPEDLAAFHGHLGPYIVIGYRIGRYARDNFCNDPFSMKARVYCSGTPRNRASSTGYSLEAAVRWGRET